jgi:hypothetical protein
MYKLLMVLVNELMIHKSWEFYCGRKSEEVQEVMGGSRERARYLAHQAVISTSGRNLAC